MDLVNWRMCVCVKRGWLMAAGGRGEEIQRKTVVWERCWLVCLDHLSLQQIISSWQTKANANISKSWMSKPSSVSVYTPLFIPPPPSFFWNLRCRIKMLHASQEGCRMWPIFVCAQINPPLWLTCCRMRLPWRHRNTKCLPFTHDWEAIHSPAIQLALRLARHSVIIPIIFPPAFHSPSALSYLSPLYLSATMYSLLTCHYI